MQVPGLGRRRSLGGLPTPLAALCAGTMHSPLLSLLALRSDRWFVAFLYLIAYCCPNCAYLQLLLVSLYFVAGGDVCPGASTLVKGPRSQGPGPVSLPLPQRSQLYPQNLTQGGKSSFMFFPPSPKQRGAWLHQGERRYIKGLSLKPGPATFQPCDHG